MIKYFFLAIGISGLIVGLEMLAVEKVTLRAQTEHVKTWMAEAEVEELEIKQHHPFQMISAGVLVILYTFTIPKKGK